ncbi:MAG: cytochrome C [Desulfobacterales bacterium]|nr:cytochrome C [Desulfobacterales bacterium]
MAKNPIPGFRNGIQVAIITIITLFWSFPGNTSGDQDRSDLVRIRVSGSPEGYQMPAVFFLHDRHTDALEKPSCEPCHLKDANLIVFKFKRLKDQGCKPDRELYHLECIKCHTDRRAQGLKSGPLTAECRRCHSQNLAYIDTAQPFGMDKSLHYRHVLSDLIRPAGNEKDGNCSACHHEYDQALKKTVYKKGQEGTCRYCHKQEKTEKGRSFKTVAHEDCLNCHFELKLQDKKAGPTICAGCHAAAKQSNIAKLEQIPRIKRNQPDVVLLSAWLQEALESGKPSNQFVEPVAFNHLSHEKQVENCRLCHHESMEPCAMCHTRTGTDKSKFFRLEQAMHSPDNLKSCLGCHRESMKSADCAGCHAQMNARRFDEIKCNHCHTVARKSLEPLPASDETRAKIAAIQINVRSVPGPVIPDDKIPEKVTIGIMTDQYESVIFPHRQIVRTLIKRTQKSILTQYFHRGTASLCSGCHHHSPSADTYPKCAACHGMSLQSDPNGKPGLKGAYHGQCSTCHQRMGLEKPVSTDCTACHQKKTKMVQQKD